MSNVKIYTGAIQYIAGVASTDIVPVTCYANSTNDTFTALVIPTAAKPTMDFLDLYDGKGNWLFAQGIPAMEAGKSYTYNLRVGKGGVTIIGITVNDWATGEVIGDAEVIKHQIGSYYFEDGTYGSDPSAGKPIGIVFYVNPDGKTGKIVSLDEATNIPWSLETVVTGATSDTDGADNTSKVFALDSYIADNTKYPAFEWCAAKNLTAPAGISWYIPAKEELKALYGTGGATKSLVNASLTTAGETLLPNWYWSSTENYDSFAWRVLFHDGEASYNYKYNVNASVRVVSAF